MPKYYEFKVCGYYLYYTASCVIEAMHVHASDRKLTEAGSAKFFVMNNGDTTVERQGQLFDALVMDYMDAEHVDKVEASAKIKELITKVRMDIEEMEAIMRTIDDRHIIYRTRAVQRAQFLLLSDGSVKSKINNMLQYYSSQIKTKEDLYEDDDTVCHDVFQVFGQNYFDSSSLATPVKKRRFY